MKLLYYILIFASIMGIQNMNAHAVPQRIKIIFTEKDCEKAESIHDAALMGCSGKTIQIFLNKGININAMDAGGRSVLTVAAVHNNIKTAKFLLQHGADPNLKGTNASGGLPLTSAAYCGYLDIVKLLIQHGANVNGVTNSGFSALQYAAMSGHLNVIKYLLAKGANPYQKDSDSSSLLFYALLSKNHLVLKEFLKYDLDVNQVLKSGWTPILDAVSRGYIEHVKILYKAGAKINVRLNSGTTLLQLAKEKEHADIVRLLKKWGLNK